MRKAHALWVPGFLSDSEKERRVRESQLFLQRYRPQGDAFLDNIITTNKTWLYIHDPETKSQYTVWRRSGSPPPEKARVSKSAEKKIYIMFCDRRGMILCKVVPTKCTVNADHYSKMQRLKWFPVDKHNKIVRLKSEAAHIFIDKDGEMVIPEAEVLDTLDAAHLQEIYHRYCEHIQVLCKLQFHIGNERDGGYHVCEDPEVIPGSSCLVYSFGIANDFSFDDGISKAFGCEVHSFDPSTGHTDHQHSQNVTFHQLGIGGKDEDKANGWKLRTLRTIRKELGHEKRHLDILKIDTEGAEWPSLSEMLRNGSIKDVRQLLVEFHLYITNDFNRTCGAQYKSNLNLLRDLYQHGFRIFYFRMWNLLLNTKRLIFKNEDGISRTRCHELHFIRIK